VCVKGINFVGLRDAGIRSSPAFDIPMKAPTSWSFWTSPHRRIDGTSLRTWLQRVADAINIPFTVGGGLRNLDDIQSILRAGADKVSLNTQAVESPSLVRESAERFGSQCIVVAIDARREGDNGSKARVFTHGGRTRTELDVVEWAKRVAELGAGEILLTSMDADGTKRGYDLSLTAQVASSVNIPVIASGGAGNLAHLLEGLTEGRASAVLAASIFHFRELTIPQAKSYLREHGVHVR
jgi:cyclase